MSRSRRYAHYNRILTIACLMALLLVCYSNCAEMRIPPLEIKNEEAFLNTPDLPNQF